jgi:hypothetical protein
MNKNQRWLTSLAVFLALVTQGWIVSGGETLPEDENPVVQLYGWLQKPVDQRGDIGAQPFSDVSLTKEQVVQAKQLLWKEYQLRHIEEARQILESEKVTDGTHTMRFAAKTFGERPVGGHSLYLSMHGGGGTTSRVNDGQWENQKRLYTVEEGIYVAPRAPTDTWNLWHQGHIDDLFRQIISAYVVTDQVNPDRVFIMGYSAGGDGVYQLAPRMADTLAAAAMMAGHPNEASPLGLRNIGFTIHMGGNDSAYNRNKIAKEWGEKLDTLQSEDPDGYVHETVIHEGKGHWMDRQDAVALKFMERFTRNVNPKRVVWYQDDVTHDRFYWLAIDPDQRRGGTKVIATVADQTVELETGDFKTMAIRLDDSLVDLDQPVTIRANRKEVTRILIPRKIGTLSRTLEQTGDPRMVWPAEITVEVDLAAGG